MSDISETNKQHSFLNPVLNVPWQAQQLKVFEEPHVLSPVNENNKPVVKRSVSEISVLYDPDVPPFKRQKTHENAAAKTSSTETAKERLAQKINTLTLRFPGLRKCEARAALTMSRMEVDKAIILLEFSDCYRREITSKSPHLGQLKSMQVNLVYKMGDNEVKISKDIGFGEKISIEDISKEMAKGSTRNIRLFTDFSEHKRVGVILVKTETGYAVKNSD